MNPNAFPGRTEAILSIVLRVSVVKTLLFEEKDEGLTPSSYQWSVYDL